MDFNEQMRHVERIVQDYIKHQLSTDVRCIEDSIMDRLIDFIERDINQFLQTKVIEKILTVNNDISAILNSKDNDPLVREFCAKYLKNKN